MAPKGLIGPENRSESIRFSASDEEVALSVMPAGHGHNDGTVP
jgi:hypothetical protein